MSFTGRMLETANYKKSVAAGKMVPTITIAHVAPNDWSMSEQMVGIMNFYDNTNVWTWKLGPEDKPDEGQYLAVTDWPQVHEVDPHTLTIKVFMRLFWIIARFYLLSPHIIHYSGKTWAQSYRGSLHGELNPLEKRGWEGLVIAVPHDL